MRKYMAVSHVLTQTTMVWKMQAAEKQPQWFDADACPGKHWVYHGEKMPGDGHCAMSSRPI